MKETRGTETSQYPEEEKTKVIPKVAASEMGRAQTMDLSMGFRTSIKQRINRRSDLERSAAEGKSPVFEIDFSRDVSRVMPSTWNSA